MNLNSIANKLGITVDKLLDILKSEGAYICDSKSNYCIKKDKEKLKKSKDLIKDCAKEYKIFIDTCSLMDEHIEEFYNNIYPYLKQNSNKVIVPHRVVEELQKHKNSQNSEKKQKAVNGLSVLVKLNKEGLLSIKGEKSDNFADNVFLSVFMKFRLNYKLLLITQDRSLAKDILDLNNSSSVKSKNFILAKKINRDGYLSDVIVDTKSSK